MNSKIYSFLGRVFGRMGRIYDKSMAEYAKTRFAFCGEGAEVLPGCQIINYEKVSLGKNSWIGHGCFIMASADVKIGEGCQIANNTIIVTTNHKINGEPYYANVEFNGVTIGDNVWIGSNVIILPGVEIGDNSVVAAGAVVTKSVPSNTIYGGIPARELRNIEHLFSSNL